MSDRAQEGRSTRLARLRVGDIVHADAPEGASLICLITDIDSDSIHSRTITTGFRVVFTKLDGRQLRDDGALCFIDSIGPLDADSYGVMLGLDRRSRLVRDGQDVRLTRAEIDALVFVASYYAATPLPPP